jgi:hypothetical protein
MPRADQDITALVERDLAGAGRVPCAADDPSTDRCAFVRATVHHSAELAVLQSDYANLALVDLDELQFADNKVARAADVEAVPFACHGYAVLQPQGTRRCVEEYRFACRRGQHLQCAGRHVVVPMRVVGAEAQDIVAEHRD